jgi:ubiquinone/menaquinone biosynthesis C-methylase UbiE
VSEENAIMEELAAKRHLTRLREAWTTEIRPDDYDAHMAQVGQAQANAQLVADWLRSKSPKADSSILFAGAGTGQMFDFISPEIFFPHRVTFTDINGDYLKRLESRVKPKTQLRFRILVDDIERSQLPEGFTLAIAVLVLEHVNWRLAVATLCRLSVESVFVVIQENTAQSLAVLSEDQPLAGTMRIFREVHPTLVNRRELMQEFIHHQFCLVYSSEKDVLYEKKMAGLGFTRKTCEHTAIRADSVTRETEEVRRSG